MVRFLQGADAGLPDQLQDLSVLGESAQRLLREDLSAIDGYLEDASTGSNQFRVNPERCFQFGGQTGRCRFVVSFHAVFDLNLHYSLPQDRVARGLSYQATPLVTKRGQDLSYHGPMPLYAVTIRVTAVPQEAFPALQAQEKLLLEMKSEGRIRMAGKLEQDEGFLAVFEAKDLLDAREIAEGFPLIREGLASWSLRAFDELSRRQSD